MTHYYNIPDLAFGPIAILAGFLVLGIAWHYGDNVRAMMATAQSDAGTVPGDGLVEVSGRIHDVPEPLTAPLSGADCVSYSLTVEEYRRKDDLTKEWVDVERIERATSFVLTDDTGTVTVDPADPSDFRCDIAQPESASREIDGQESPELAVDIDDSSDDELPRRYRERHLPASEDLYVLGTASAGGDRIENAGGEPFTVSTDSEWRTIGRHVAYSLVASGVGIALVGWGCYILLGRAGVI